MKQYASIPYFDGQYLLGHEIIAFDKLDGNNMRFEWSKANGWFQFGTRTSIINASDEKFGKAIPAFMMKYSQRLENIIKTNEKYRRVKGLIAFCEWVGLNSFAGRHVSGDQMDIVLFDVNPIGKGLVPPQEFIGDFGVLGIPRVIYKGVLTTEFAEKVRTNIYNLKEGVVCKAVKKETGNRVLMVKIKTAQWFDRFKAMFGEQALKEELAGLR